MHQVKGVAECTARAVYMEMCEEACAVVVDDGIRSRQIEVEIDRVHQESFLSPLLFNCVMNVLTNGVRGICKRLMYADDAVLIGESIEEAIGCGE